MPAEFPKIMFGRLKSKVKRLMDLAHTYGVFNKAVTGEVISSLVSLLDAELSKTNQANQAAITTTVMDIAGEVANQATLTEFFERVAANVKRIAKGIPAVKFKFIKDYVGWTCLKFEDLEYKDNNKLVTFTLCSKYGRSYGLKFKVTYPYSSEHIDKLLYRLGAADKGSTRTPRELIQLCFWGEVYRKTIDGRSVVKFGRWIVDKSLRSYNRRIISKRRKNCPVGYKWPCAKCHVGYDKCALGCRAVTKEVKINVSAKRTESGINSENRVPGIGVHEPGA
jgi:hypothetical protein